MNQIKIWLIIQRNKKTIVSTLANVCYKWRLYPLQILQTRASRLIKTSQSTWKSTDYNSCTQLWSQQNGPTFRPTFTLFNFLNISFIVFTPFGDMIKRIVFSNGIWSTVVNVLAARSIAYECHLRIVCGCRRSFVYRNKRQTCHTRNWRVRFSYLSLRDEERESCEVDFEQKILDRKIPY